MYKQQGMKLVVATMILMFFTIIMLIISPTMIEETTGELSEQADQMDLGDGAKSFFDTKIVQWAQGFFTVLLIGEIITLIVGGYFAAYGDERPPYQGGYPQYEQ